MILLDSSNNVISDIIKRYITNNVRKLKFATYNLTNKGQLTWYDLALEIAYIKNKENLVQYVSEKDFYSNIARPSWSCLDGTRIERNGYRIPHWKNAIYRFMKEINEI